MKEIVLDGAATNVVHQLGCPGEARNGAEWAMSEEKKLQALNTSPLLSKIIHYFPGEATRLPLEFNDGTNDLSAEGNYAIALKMLEHINAYEAMRLCMINALTDNYAYLIIGPPNDELARYAEEVEKLSDDTFLLAARKHQINVFMRSGGMSGSEYSYQLKRDQLPSIDVHPSRVITFRYYAGQGVEAVHPSSSPVYAAIAETSSFLERIWPAVRQLDEMYPTLFELVRSYSTLTVGIEDLAEKLKLKGGEGKVLDRLRLVRKGLNALNAIFKSKDTEEISFVERRVTGIEKAYQPLIDRVVGLSNIPESILYLIVRGGGISDGSGLRDRAIAAQQTLQLQNKFRAQWAALLALYPEPLTAPFIFPSTLVLDAREEAEIAKLKVETAKLEAETQALMAA